LTPEDDEDDEDGPTLILGREGGTCENSGVTGSARETIGSRYLLDTPFEASTRLFAPSIRAPKRETATSVSPPDTFGPAFTEITEHHVPTGGASDGSGRAPLEA